MFRSCRRIRRLGPRTSVPTHAGVKLQWTASAFVPILGSCDLAPPVSTMAPSVARFATRIAYGATQLPRVAWYMGHGVVCAGCPRPCGSAAGRARASPRAYAPRGLTGDGWLTFSAVKSPRLRALTKFSAYERAKPGLAPRSAADPPPCCPSNAPHRRLISPLGNGRVERRHRNELPRGELSYWRPHSFAGRA